MGDPDALLPGATAVHLLIVPYQTFAWREDEPSVNAFYPAYQNGRNIAQKLVEALQAEGIRAINAPNLPLKPLALATGCVSMGRNCLVGAREYGTRFTLQCALSDLEPTDAAAPAARGRLSRECARCRACLRACPTGALNGDGTIQAERCLRIFSYSEPIPEGMRPLLASICMAATFASAFVPAMPASAPWNRRKSCAGRCRSKRCFRGNISRWRLLSAPTMRAATA